MSGTPNWQGERAPRFDVAGVRGELHRLHDACHIVADGDAVGAVSGGRETDEGGLELLASVPRFPSEMLGSATFRDAHGVRLAYMAGAMANGIASEELVVAMAEAGLLASFGAAGLAPDRIASALNVFESKIPGRPFACNLIHSPAGAGLERATVDLFLDRRVRLVEASAFLGLTAEVVRYRVAGLARDRDGGAVARNHVIAKVSRPETAEMFLRPAPREILDTLAAEGRIGALQAELAGRVPLADDITVEADSGGHTDRRPSTVVTAAVLRLRDRITREAGYPSAPRVGAAGGLGSPEGLAAAFAMGADYVVTGSVNQSCVEAGTSPEAKELLTRAGVADYAMAPAADMFEIGADVQVLRSGTMFPMRASRLREYYRTYDGLEAIPAIELSRLEKDVFRMSVDEVWRECLDYFGTRDPGLVDRATEDPKVKMALVFRWYLGMSTRWAVRGETGRVRDYQVWCGPAMGAFNDWAKDSHLFPAENRTVVEVAEQLMHGAAYLFRLRHLGAAGAALATPLNDYRPAPLLSRPEADPMRMKENPR
ncbi:PfaD family polyunsaturated fatty acid/polyketide biosynthesis protein [Streptomyces luteireticuli]|uniref:PfaD family polyunsaturated fatty acid/polyketide biosynthesis protein n=1 Tax=Streptomyces luteireticuli TaxID=173858 RepID=A0ABN0YH21_9ACTN